MWVFVWSDGGWLVVDDVVWGWEIGGGCFKDWWGLIKGLVGIASRTSRFHSLDSSCNRSPRVRNWSDATEGFRITWLIRSVHKDFEMERECASGESMVLRMIHYGADALLP